MRIPVITVQRVGAFATLLAAVGTSAWLGGGHPHPRRPPRQASVHQARLVLYCLEDHNHGMWEHFNSPSASLAFKAGPCPDGAPLPTFEDDILSG